MRIAVTGGNGKLGRVTVEVLRSAGHEVVVLDQAVPDRSAFTQRYITAYGKWIDCLAFINDRPVGVEAVAHLDPVFVGLGR